MNMAGTPKTPCWMISLTPEAPRVLDTLAAIRAQGIDTAVFAAVDGRESPPVLQPPEIIDQFATRWRHLSVLSDSELGCYLSHLRAIRQAYEQGLAHICILEDDIRIEADFAAVLAELETLPGNVEMIRLMGLKVRRRRIVHTLRDRRHQLVRPERGWCGAQGYLLNRRGMQKILDRGGRIYEPIDKLFDHFWEFDLKLYGVEPHIIWEDRPQEDTTVVKVERNAQTMPRLIRALYPIGKLWRSIIRHWYLIRHHSDFYPAEQPSYVTGRTPRLRS